MPRVPLPVDDPSSETPPSAPERLAVRRALVSVYDKRGLTELGRALHSAGVEIVSTGSTARALVDAGIPVTAVEDVTGHPECLDGRVKTLHPRVHAGILADLRKHEHVEQLADLGVEPFGLVVVNLYPFAETVAAGADQESAIEQIDIGGPAMVRAAAKNHASVAVLTEPARYDWAARQVAAGGFALAQRQSLARDAFRHTATYDLAVATWLTSQFPDAAAGGESGSGGESPSAATAVDDGGPSAGGDTPLASWLGGTWTQVAALRYGENPHQRGALMAGQFGPGQAGRPGLPQAEVAGRLGSAQAGLPQAEQLGGKAMSFNNYGDADAAWRAVWDFGEPAVAIIKHANPCGLAVGADIAAAHAAAHACDPASAYGGVVAANRTVTRALAQQLKPVFTEVIVAPGYDAAALELLRTKTSLRILRLPPAPPPATEARFIVGGLLVQDRDRLDAPGDDPANWRLVAGPAAGPQVLADLAFAWRAVRAVKSNAIVLARAGATVGIGMGQVNRVDSAFLAVRRAGPERARGAVAASDAFFPFADGAQILFDAGVAAIVQPGGSIRDAEVIAAAEAAGVTMYLTGARHFNH